MATPETAAEERARALQNEAKRWRAVRDALPVGLSQEWIRLMAAEASHAYRAKLLLQPPSARAGD